MKEPFTKSSKTGGIEGGKYALTRNLAQMIATEKTLLKASQMPGADAKLDDKLSISSK